MNSGYIGSGTILVVTFFHHADMRRPMRRTSLQITLFPADKIENLSSDSANLKTRQ